MAGQVQADDALLAYVRDVSLRDDPLLAELRAETAGMPILASMLVMPEEAQLLALLVQLVGARTVVEVGTFTGYSTLCMARAAGPGSRVVTCDVNRRWTGIAERYWERAQVRDRIDLRVQDGEQALRGLLDEGLAGAVDLVFVDADKAGYPRYYELGVDLLRPGGLLVVDNTLFFGSVADPSAHGPDTEAVRALNLRVRDDPRVDAVLLTMADGITLARKR